MTLTGKDVCTKAVLEYANCQPSSDLNTHTHTYTYILFLSLTHSLTTDVSHRIKEESSISNILHSIKVLIASSMKQKKETSLRTPVKSTRCPKRCTYLFKKKVPFGGYLGKKKKKRGSVALLTYKGTNIGTRTGTPCGT